MQGLLLSLDAEGNPSQQDQSKELHVELRHQQPTLNGHLWVSLSTNSLDFPTEHQWIYLIKE